MKEKIEIIMKIHTHSNTISIGMKTLGSIYCADHEKCARAREHLSVRSFATILLIYSLGQCFDVIWYIKLYTYTFKQRGIPFENRFCHSTPLCVPSSICRITILPHSRINPTERERSLHVIRLRLYGCVCVWKHAPAKRVYSITTTSSSSARCVECLVQKNAVTKTSTHQSITHNIYWFERRKKVKVSRIQLV